MESKPETIILKRRQNLGKLIKTSQVYHQNTVDYESEGVPISYGEGANTSYEEFNPHTDNLFGTMTNLTPHFSGSKKEWSFEGSFQDLVRIAEQLALRDKDNNLIIPDKTCFRNRLDPFFNHELLWKSIIMHEGKMPLNSEDPWEEFYSRVYKGRSDVRQPSKTQSNFEVDGSSLEIISPKEIKEKKSKEIEIEIKAITMLESMTWDKQKRIASILDLPAYHDNHNDPDALKVLLYTSCATNDETTVEGRTVQKRFIELSELDNAELEILSKVFAAKNKGHIRIRRDGATFKGETIGDGQVKSIDQLMKYYVNPDNYEAYREVENLVETL